MGTSTVAELVNRIHTSIIIPTLHSPWLAEIAASLHAQRYDLAGTEVLIVGLDRNAAGLQDALIRHIPTARPTPPAQARNRGIKAAQGEILCFLDSDCIPDPGWLANLTRPYQSSDVHVVGGVITFPQNYWTICDSVAHFAPVIAQSGYQKTITHLPTLNFSARHTVFEQAGYFDEAFLRPSGEDTELTKRMRTHGYQLHLAKDACIFHAAERDGLNDVLRRAIHHGQAVRVASYRQQFVAESSRFTWWFLLLTAIPRALATTMQIYAVAPGLRRYWPAIPAVFAIKLAWVLSVAVTLLSNTPGNAPGDASGDVKGNEAPLRTDSSGGES